MSKWVGLRGRSRIPGALVAFGLLLTALGAASSRADAAVCSGGGSECPSFLGRIGSFGTGAGQLYVASVAADPQTGHVFAAEAGNNRISEFDPDGTFIEAWGWGVRDGTPTLQSCTSATGCLAGQSGTGGVGEVQEASGVAIDHSGNVWVAEAVGSRVEKFTPDGEALLMLGREVNKSRVKEREEQELHSEPITVTEADENLCTASSGDTCGASKSGSGASEFSSLESFDGIEVGPDGKIYVGDEDRIQKFAEDGVLEGVIALPGSGMTMSLTVAPNGHLFVISSNITETISNGSEEVPSLVVRELTSAGGEVSRLQGAWEGRTVPKDPVSVAVDAEGNVYVIGTVIYQVPVEEGKDPKFVPVKEVVGFDSTGNLISFRAGQAGFGASSDSSDPQFVATNVVGDGSGDPGEIFVEHFFNGGFKKEPKLSYIEVYGKPFEDVMMPPAVVESFVKSVSVEGAVVEARVKPGFTPDTTYQVEFGTGKCSDGDCDFLAPASPAALGGEGLNASIATGPIALENLQPGTTYHYRLRAANAVTAESEMGPVHGEEGSLRTYGSPGPAANCPNGSLRAGASAELPDCRAYEMVSPVNKGGGPIYTLEGSAGYPAGITRSGLNGDAFTFSSYRAFADPDSGPYSSQYLARRDPGTGWASEPISPPRAGVLFAALDTQFRAFTEDLSASWLVTDSDPPLAAGAVEGFRNFYRRDNQAGAYEAQCPIEPPDTPVPAGFYLEPQGFSADGSHVVIWANRPLTPDAPAGTTPQVYECVDGTELRLVGLLPNGEPSVDGSTAGTASKGIGGTGFRENNVTGAVSADGSRVFWTAKSSGSGPLYVRIGGQKTVQVAPSGAQFRIASPDGTRVIYSKGSELLEANVGEDSSSSSPIAGEVLGVMGASRDTGIVYFVSREDLDATGPALAGSANLYLYRAQPHTYTHIGALSNEDARELLVSEESSPGLTPVALSPYYRGSRISIDGLHAAFVSNAPLTGYDNTDQVSGKPDYEVFLYDAQSAMLFCVSCNPGGARPRGANASTPLTPFWAAAKIPGWENQFYAGRILSEDGSRLVFDSYDSLTPRDTNAAEDVYQWEEPGTGTCTESSPSYSPANGGCIDLVSSGRGSAPSALLDGSTEGSDVFFTTASSLWAGDYGEIDIYDARVDGGFPPPAEEGPVCEGEVCQGPPLPPEAQRPSSATFVGAGNAVEPLPRKAKHCRRGSRRLKRKGNLRCHKNRSRKTGSSRRAGR